MRKEERRKEARSSDCPAESRQRKVGRIGAVQQSVRSDNSCAQSVLTSTQGGGQGSDGDSMRWGEGREERERKNWQPHKGCACTRAVGLRVSTSSPCFLLYHQRKRQKSLPCPSLASALKNLPTCLVLYLPDKKDSFLKPRLQAEQQLPRLGTTEITIDISQPAVSPPSPLPFLTDLPPSHSAKKLRVPFSAAPDRPLRSLATFPSRQISNPVRTEKHLSARGRRKL